MAYDPFKTDPIYQAVRKAERANRMTVSSQQEIAGDGMQLSGPITRMTPDTMPTVDPTFGTTQGYSTAQRVGEGVGSNVGAIYGAGVTRSLSPLAGAAIDVGINTLLGDTPGYLESPSVEEGVKTQTGGFSATKQYVQTPTGAIVQYDPSMEEVDGQGKVETLTAAQAARRSPMGYTGADPRTPLGAVGQGVQSLATSMVPLAGLIFGKTVESPIGTPMALGAGPLGVMVHDRMYETHANIEKGLPGNFGMQIGNRYVTYNANDQYIGGKFGETVGLRKAKTAGLNMTTEQFQRIYGANAGFDPRTVDWTNSRPGELKGEVLNGFVQGQGGFTSNGEFVDSQGRISNSISGKPLDRYIDNAMVDAATAMSALEALEAKAEAVKDDFLFAESKSEYYSKKADTLRQRIADGDYGAPEPTGRGFQGKRVDSRGNTVNYNLDSDPETSSPTTEAQDQRASEEAQDSVDNSTPDQREEEEDQDSTDNEYAEGGFVQKKAVGGPIEEQVGGPVGFVNGKTPDEVSPQKAIADDVEGSVPEGTFVINAPAVERAGSSDIRKMLVNAIQEAKAQGIDLSGSGVKMDSEEAVSVAVSEGEVLVPPVLARIIGYDRLEKINKRGEAEVAKRQQEAEAQQQNQQNAPQPMMARGGGFISKS